MNAKDVIKNTINTGNMILTTYVGDMTDDDLMVRVTPGANHIAWQLGHLIASEHKMVGDAGFTTVPLPDGLAETHATEATSSDDASKFHKKDQYLAWMQEQRAATFAALDALADADLDKESPEAMRAYCPKVADVFNLIGIHLVMHAAQWVPLRRKLGKPILI